MPYKKRVKLNKKFFAVLFAVFSFIAIAPVLSQAFILAAASGFSIGNNNIGTKSEKLYGNGTENKPYEVYSYEDLLFIEYQINASNNSTYKKAYYTLMNNIDCGDKSIKPIGYYYGASNNRAFDGTFNGNGYSINNFNIYLTFSGSLPNSISLGLFAYNTGTIKNLTVEKGSTSTISVNDRYSETLYYGGICGYNAGNIVGCTNKINVDFSCVAKYDATVTNTLDAYIGGICGDSTTELKNCTNFGNLTGKITTDTKNNNISTGVTYYIGGITGQTSNNINNCFNYGNIKAEEVKQTYCGGIVGRFSAAEISTCFSKAQNIKSVGSESSYAGGIIAYTDNDILVNNCFNESEICAGVVDKTSEAYGGGLIGYVSGNLNIKNVYNIGNIISYAKEDIFPIKAYAGGFVGHTYSGDIVNAYSTGKVEGNGYNYLTKKDEWIIPRGVIIENTSDDDRYFWNDIIYNYTEKKGDLKYTVEYSHCVTTFNPIVGNSESVISYNNVKYVERINHDTKYQGLSLKLKKGTSTVLELNVQAEEINQSAGLVGNTKYTLTLKNYDTNSRDKVITYYLRDDEDNEENLILSNISSSFLPSNGLCTWKENNYKTYNGEQGQIFYNKTEGENWLATQDIEKFAMNYSPTSIKLGFYHGLQLHDPNYTDSHYYVNFYTWAFNYPNGEEDDEDLGYGNEDWTPLFKDYHALLGPISTINGIGVYRFYGSNEKVEIGNQGSLNIIKVSNFGDEFNYISGELPTLKAFNW